MLVLHMPPRPSIEEQEGCGVVGIDLPVPVRVSKPARYGVRVSSLAGDEAEMIARTRARFPGHR